MTTKRDPCPDRVPNMSGHPVTPCPTPYRGTRGEHTPKSRQGVSRSDLAAYTSGVLRARADYLSHHSEGDKPI